ncbi:hypothetical protein GGR95_003675 [Sulfitobacter undariae]|uniref:Uncharacterized protein n=1 Tax=Sulfitobacter undariae TaxID=1563671 RepID=A0A7W6E881_9RHOB|nr:hypothetical protein [Sulfitobacter undariae]
MIRLGPFPNPKIAYDPYLGASLRQLRDYLRRPKQERAQRRAQIDESFYFWEPVQSAVQERCFEKCVFCERSSRDVETLIETFRPLRDAGNGNGDSEQDHYVWLAYEPENLILVCIECSSRKRTEFPVIGPRAPYLTPMSEISGREKPLIVDPYRGNPERHFLFLADGRCEGVTKEGRFTSWLLGLNESRLLGARAGEMDTFLGHLRASIETDGRGVAAYLDPRTPFAGARIGVARRLFGPVAV